MLRLLAQIKNAKKCSINVKLFGSEFTVKTLLAGNLETLLASGVISSEIIAWCLKLFLADKLIQFSIGYKVQICNCESIHNSQEKYPILNQQRNSYNYSNRPLHHFLKIDIFETSS